jgi:hypothetical protein
LILISQEEALEISSEQIARFREDGFMSVDGLLDEKGVEAARNAFDALFRSEFERGILPDEVNWKEGKSDPTLTRQICNGWKANTAIARIVLREDIGQAIAALADWQGTRILQKLGSAIQLRLFQRSPGCSSTIKVRRTIRPAGGSQESMPGPQAD